MQSEDILVVGAGPAGLATAACLRREGLAHVVLEREEQIAGAWHRHYDRLHLHTTKTHSGLPMTPWPKATPRYPSRAQVVQYLQAYAAEHRVTPRLGVTVHAVQRNGDRFTVETSAGVYKNAAPYRGKRTLVVGCGNSGAEIALDLAEQGVDVAMVVRGPVHVVPRDMFGRPTQHTNILLSHLPLSMRDAIAGGTMAFVVGDLSRWGIVRPVVGPNRMIEESGRIPILDVGTIAMVKRGKIRVLPAVEEILADSVRVAGGAEHPFEAIIFATGYTPGLDKVIKGFERIADARGRPNRFGAETGIPGLYCVGFKNPPTGALREIALEAPRVARSIRAAGGAA